MVEEKIPLEASLMEWAPWEDAAAIGDAPGQVPGDIQLLPGRETRAIYSLFGKFWERRACSRTRSLENGAKKPQNTGFFPLSLGRVVWGWDIWCHTGFC